MMQYLMLAKMHGSDRFYFMGAADDHMISCQQLFNVAVNQPECKGSQENANFREWYDEKTGMYKYGELIYTDRILIVYILKTHTIDEVLHEKPNDPKDSIFHMEPGDEENLQVTQLMTPPI